MINNNITKSFRQRILLLLLLLLFPVLAFARSRSAFIPSNRAINRHVKHRLQHRGGDTASISARSHLYEPLTKLRAGGSTILPLAAVTTAKVATAFLGLNGMILLSNPTALMQHVYHIPQPDDADSNKSLTTWILRGMGALGLGVAIQIYASIVAEGLAARTAMGLGLLPRAIFYLYTLLSGQMKDLNIQQRFFTTNTILTTWATASLLFDLGNASKTAKMYSFMCLLKSIFFVWAPGRVSLKLLGNSCEGQALALMRGAGNELLTSALLMMSSAWGVTLLTPVAAAGSVCLVWMVLLADMAWLDQTWRLMGSSGPRAQLVHMVIAGTLAAGFLLPK